jgi:hypothetical protein
VCRKAPAAVAVQGRHQAPLRSHKGAGSRRSGGAGSYSPRTCCRRVSAAVSPGSTQQPQLPSGTWIWQRTLPVGALGGRYVCCPAVRSAHRGFKNRRGTRASAAVGGAGSYRSMTPPCRLYYLSVRVRARLFRPGPGSYLCLMSLGTHLMIGTDFQ